MQLSLKCNNLCKKLENDFGLTLTRPHTFLFLMSAERATPPSMHVDDNDDHVEGARLCL